MSDPSQVNFHLSPDAASPTPADSPPDQQPQQHTDDAVAVQNNDKSNNEQEKTAAASATAPADVTAESTANGSSAAVTAPAAAATAEGEGAGGHKEEDLDYENTGQGFVSRATLVRKGSMSAKRPSFNLSEGLAAAAPSNVAGAPAAIELTERKGLLAGAEERKQPEGTKDSAVIDMKGADGPSDAPTDALWMLTLPQLASKFPDSAIDPANPRASRGLTSQRAAELLAQNGRNELKPPAEHSEFVKYLLQFTDPSVHHAHARLTSQSPRAPCKQSDKISHMCMRAIVLSVCVCDRCAGSGSWCC